jgi:hypothetical protein
MVHPPEVVVVVVVVVTAEDSHSGLDPKEVEDCSDEYPKYQDACHHRTLCQGPDGRGVLRLVSPVRYPLHGDRAYHE